MHIASNVKSVGVYSLAAVLVSLLVATFFENEDHSNQSNHSNRSSIEIYGLTQGTSYSVKAFGLPPEIPNSQLRREVEQELSSIDSQLSSWNATSEISRFNKYQGTDWFAVSETTCKVVAAGLEMSRKSGGAFDITVSPLVELWGFGVMQPQFGLPSELEIKAAQRLVNWKNIQVRNSPPAIRKRLDTVRIDVAGIAQGFSVDRLAAVLKKAGAMSFLVEIGGEEVVYGLKPDGTQWRIGIERPTESDTLRGGIQKIILLKDQAVATSGDYRHFREVKGKRYSHTIDPRTGRPITHELASVTVVADTCMEADAISTAIMVLGPEEGYEWAVQSGISAMLVARQDNGFSIRETPSFTKIEEITQLRQEHPGDQ